jgi:predicted RecA/RadA family phage recombinase
MANNFVSRGEVLTLTAAAARESGNPYREHGFNGVALIDAAQNEAYTLQIRGIFEFALASVSVGDLIYIDSNNDLTLTSTNNTLYGRAVTATDADGNFHCLILQAE